MRAVAAILAVSVLTPGICARADEVLRKGGEWRTVVTGITPEPQTIVMCFSQTTWEQAMARASSRGTCSKRSIVRNGKQIAIDIVCDQMAMQGTATVIGDSAYTADLTMRIGAGANARVVHSTTDAKWIGVCKPGERVLD